MSIFTQIQLKTYIERIELQQHNLPLATVFTAQQKNDLDSLYDQILKICYATSIKEKEVIEPICL
jgi:hypothetical protein